MDRYLCITCEVLARPVYWCAATSPHLLDVELLKRGLHNQPLNLRAKLQERIDEAENQAYNGIILVYGLCGQATAGLVARSIPLIIPRAHDCITLFLGSRARYQDQFENYPGTYWYSQDYIERDDGSGTTLSMGSGSDTDLQSVYAEYVDKYGKENADYLMEVMGAWQQHYRRAVYIDLGIGNGSKVERKAQDEAARRGWSFEKLIGDLNLVRDLLEGNWQGKETNPAQTQENNRFLIVPPGQTISMTYDNRVIDCEKGST
jgi:hypothetical protein